MNAERSVNIITCTVVKPAEQNCKNFLEAYHISRRQSSIFRTHTMCRTHTHAHTYSTMGPSKSPQILTRSPNSLNTYKFRDQNQEWRGNRRGSIWPKYMGQTLWEPIICKFNKFFDNHIDKKCSMRKNHAHIKHVPQNILHLIDETLYEKESHSCVQIPFRFFQNQIDKMLHDEKESCTHVHTFHRKVSFTKVLPGSQSSRSI